IGGRADDVEAACRVAKERGGRGLPINVAGAFHTSLMENAARTFEAVLEAVPVQSPAIPLIGNVTALPLESPGEVVSELGRQMARQGAAVAVNYHKSEEQAHALRKEIEEAGGRAIAVRGDVRVPEDTERMVQETIDGLGRLDVLVNNAGFNRDTLLLRMSL